MGAECPWMRYIPRGFVLLQVFGFSGKPRWAQSVGPACPWKLIRSLRNLGLCGRPRWVQFGAFWDEVQNGYVGPFGAHGSWIPRRYPGRRNVGGQDGCNLGLFGTSSGTFSGCSNGYVGLFGVPKWVEKTPVDAAYQHGFVLLQVFRFSGRPRWAQSVGPGVHGLDASQARWSQEICGRPRRVQFGAFWDVKWGVFGLQMDTQGPLGGQNWLKRRPWMRFSAGIRFVVGFGVLKARLAHSVSPECPWTLDTSQTHWRQEFGSPGEVLLGPC